MSETPPTATTNARSARRWLPSRGQAVLAFAVAIVLLLLNDFFLVESIDVPTASMAPTILPNERLWMLHRYGYQYQRFDVVVIKLNEPETRIVKRIIGLPGDHIEIDDGWRVKINGAPLDYAPGPLPQSYVEAAHHLVQTVPRQGAATAPTRVFFMDHLGKDEYFVMGDNRFDSADSREIGVIRRDQIQGTAIMTWYSFAVAEHQMRWDRVFRAVR